MARISSQTLFNFTDTIEFLIDNLENGFYCHTTFEKLPYGKNGYRVPMACFCDIPLSLIKEHFNWYGRYGIGIKKSYGRELGVKPVWGTSPARVSWFEALLNLKRLPITSANIYFHL